ncbi:MAG: DUF3810 domain-containing protein [Bacteroidota bacterium]
MMGPTKKDQLRGIGNLDRRFTWIGMGLLTGLITFLLSLNPTFTEVVYSRGVFVLIRWVWDYTIGWIPFPLIYLLLAGLLYWIISGLIASRKTRSIQPFRNQLAGYVFSFLAFLSAVYVIFQLLWGFNYQRQPIEASLGLAVAWPDSVELVQEFNRVTDKLTKLREKVSSASAEGFSFEEAYLRKQLVVTLEQNGYPTPGRPRGKTVAPKGSLMHWGALGIYLPFIGEGSIDAGLPEITLPFTLIHELSHGYGFGDEGTANFWAYLSCTQSSDIRLQYIGELSYWRHLARLVYYDHPEEYERVRDSLSPAIMADLDLIRKTYAAYPAYFPEFFAKVYDRYLKSQGIEEGVKSYSRVVALIMAWDEKQLQVD